MIGSNPGDKLRREKEEGPLGILASPNSMRGGPFKNVIVRKQKWWIVGKRNESESGGRKVLEASGVTDPRTKCNQGTTDRDNPEDNI